MTADSPEADEYNYYDEYWRCGRNDGCGQAAGWGTDHVGVGACKLHGGNAGAPSGPDNGNWKHGLFSEVVREEDKATLKKIEDMTTAAKLESTLNMQIMKLHRAVEQSESAEQSDFWGAFADLMSKVEEPEETDLRSLASMLTQNDRYLREWMDLIRKSAKDLHKITEGEQVTVEHGVDEDALAEVRDAVESAYSGE